MAFREVTMIEVKEALRQWLAGAGKKRIGARVGLDPKTVRRYVRAGEACGLAAGQGESALTDEVLAAGPGDACRCARAAARRLVAALPRAARGVPCW